MTASCDEAREANLKAERALVRIGAHEETCVALAKQTHDKIDNMDRHNMDSHAVMYGQIQNLSTRVWLLVVGGMAWVITTLANKLLGAF